MGTDKGALIAGRYELITMLGQGGMGAAWQAQDRALDRDVVLKRLTLPTGLREKDRRALVTRMEREARAAGRLRHPAIVTIYDQITDDDGLPWIVMELVHGRSLEETVKTDGRLPADRVARIGAQVAGALAVAHATGIVHRDVKPANVLLEGERVVLTDFGIAVWEGDVTLTPSGVMVGTPAYMAPEQVNGAEAGPASDMWSLGTTLYTAVEGVPAFTAPNAAALLLAISLGQYPPAVHAGPLQPILSGLMQISPEGRPTASEAAIALADPTAEVPRSPSALPVSRLPLHDGHPGTPESGSTGHETTTGKHRAQPGPTGLTIPFRSARRNGPARSFLIGAGLLAAIVASGIGVLALKSSSDQDPPVSLAPEQPTQTQTRVNAAPPTPLPSKSDYSFSRELYRDSTWVLTLTRITLSQNGELKVFVQFHNASGAAAGLSCQPVTDPAASNLELATGNTIRSTATFCSDNPTRELTLGAGKDWLSYAVFPPSKAYGQPFALNWQPGIDLSGTVTNIDLS
jgi:serine/threonine protein kinase